MSRKRLFIQRTALVVLLLTAGVVLASRPPRRLIPAISLVAPSPSPEPASGTALATTPPPPPPRSPSPSPSITAPTATPTEPASTPTTLTSAPTAPATPTAPASTTSTPAARQENLAAGVTLRPEKKSVRENAPSVAPGFTLFKVARIDRTSFPPAKLTDAKRSSRRASVEGPILGTAEARERGLSRLLPWDGLSLDHFHILNHASSGGSDFTAQHGARVLRLTPWGRVEAQGRWGDRDGRRFLSSGALRLHSRGHWELDLGDKSGLGRGPALTSVSARGIHLEHATSLSDAGRALAGISIGRTSLKYANLERGRFPRELEAGYLRIERRQGLNLGAQFFRLRDQAEPGAPALESVRNGAGFGLSIQERRERTMLQGSLLGTAFRYRDGARDDGLLWSAAGRTGFGPLAFGSSWQRMHGTAYRAGSYGALQPAPRSEIEGDASLRLARRITLGAWAGSWSQPAGRADASEGTDGPLGSLSEARNRSQRGRKWGGKIAGTLPGTRTGLSLSVENRERSLEDRDQEILNTAVTATQSLRSGQTATLRWNRLDTRGDRARSYVTGDLGLRLGGHLDLTLQQRTMWQEPLGPRLHTSAEISSDRLLGRRVQGALSFSQVHEADAGSFLPVQTTGGARTDLQLGRAWRVSCQYQVTRHREEDVRTLRISLNHAQTPLLGDLSGSAEAAPAPALQILSGVVFDDANDNGARDPGEAGVPDIAVLIDNDPQSPSYTNHDGEYRCLLSPGRHLVRLLPESVPIDYTLQELGPDEVDLSLDGPAQHAFRLIRQTCAISGRVCLVRQPGVPVPTDVGADGGVPSVRVVLNEDDFTYTDRRGGYSFRPLSAGSYTVKVDEATVPFGYAVEGSTVQRVEVSEASGSEAICGFSLARPVAKAVFRPGTGAMR